MSAARKGAAIVAGVQPIPVARVRIDGGTQQREHLNSDALFDYVDAVIDGVDMPPILVYSDGSDYWLVDGFHRLEAHKRARREIIVADVRKGSLREAILASVGVNAQNGVRRSNEDKRKAVRTLLLDEEWSKWTNRAIAAACRVSDPFVGEERRRLTANVSSRPPTNADNQRVGRDGRTYDVSKLSAPEAPPAKSEPPKAAPLLDIDDIDAAVRALAGLLQDLGAVEQDRAVPAVMTRRQLAIRLKVAKIKDDDWEEILDEGRVAHLWVCDAEVDGGPQVLWLLDQDDPAVQGRLAALEEEDTDPDTDGEGWEEENLEEEDPGEGPVVGPDSRGGLRRCTSATVEEVLSALERMVREAGGSMGTSNARACLWKLGPLTDEEWGAVLDLGTSTGRVVRDDARGEVVCIPKEGSSNGRTSDVGSSPTPSPSVPSSAELEVTASAPGGVAVARRPHGEEVAQPLPAAEKSGSTPGPGTRALPDNERAALDAYWTPDRHASALARWLDERLFAGEAPRRVLEPSVGGGAWVRAARDLWPSAKVDGLDLDASAPGLALVDGFTVCDFMEAELDEYDLVVGNPPYGTDLIAWVDRSRQVGRVVAYLMRSTFAGSRKRARWFGERARPAHVIVPSPRPPWQGPGKRATTDKVDSFFFVWTPGQPARTEMHFLELDDQDGEDLEDEEVEP